MEKYKKLDWGTFLIENSFGKETKYYSKNLIYQNYGLSKNEVDQYLSLGLKILKIIEQKDGKDVLKEFHLVKSTDVEDYLEFRNKHKKLMKTSEKFGSRGKK